MNSDSEVISVVLLPQAEDSRLLAACSEVITRRVAGSKSMGTPHITIAQFAAPKIEAKDLWNQIEHLKATIPALQAGGLCFLPSHRNAEMWVEVQILKSSALQEFQSAVLETEFAGKHEALNGQGDEFRPHYTLALLEQKIIPEMDIAQFDDFRKEYSGLTLAVALNGENYSLAEIMFS